MSHFTDERGRQLNERIILLLNDEVGERLRQTIASDSTEFPIEALLELLAKQVWAFYEDQKVYLVTRSITLIGKTVQVSRGDYALQVDSVITTNHSMVTQAFRLGVRVETDWEIVTPLRGLPYPTTRGALQLLESLTAEEQEPPVVAAPDGVWSENTQNELVTAEAISEVIEHDFTNPNLSQPNDIDHNDHQHNSNLVSESNDDDPQRIIDELLGRLNQSASQGDQSISKNLADESQTIKISEVEIKADSQPISAPELLNPNIDSIAKPLDLLKTINDSTPHIIEPSDNSSINNTLPIADNSKGSSIPREESENDPQSLVDQWLKNIIAQQTTETNVPEINQATDSSTVSLSHDTPEEPKQLQNLADQSIGNANQQTLVNDEQTFPDRSIILPTPEYFSAIETSSIPQQEDVPQIPLVEQVTEMEKTLNESSQVISNPVIDDLDMPQGIREEPQKEINILGASDDKEANPQSLIDQWIKSMAPTQDNENIVLAEEQEGERESTEEEVSPQVTEPIFEPVIQETVMTQPIESVSKESVPSSSSNDTFDFFDNLFSNFAPKGPAEQVPAPSPVELSANVAPIENITVPSSIQQKISIDIDSMLPFFTACGQPWLDTMSRWAQESTDPLLWPSFAEKLPVRLVWIVSTPERAEELWAQMNKGYHCRRVLFKDDSILQQIEGKHESDNKESWLGKYRQARLSWESDAAKLRLLRSQLDLIGKYFQDYITFKKELHQLEDKAEVSVPAAKLNTPQMGHFKKELIKLLAKQAETEERLRSWIYSTREVRHCLSPKYLELQEEYRDLLTRAAIKGRELNQLLSSAQEMRPIQPVNNKDRARLNQELMDIDRYINETYGKYWNKDSIWSMFEQKDLQGIKDNLTKRESILAVEERALGNWQNIIEQIPAILFPQVWIGSCRDMSQFLFHQFYPHIVIAETEQDIESLYSTPWLVIRSDGERIKEYTPGQTEAPYDPQLLWGVCGSDDDCKKMTAVSWDQRELAENGGKTLA